jgi:hypothetical protein
MSEITTGTVSLSLIGLPLAIGAAVIGSIYFASKYCVKQHEKMLREIETTDARLKWLDKNLQISPKKITSEAKKIQDSITNNSIFKKATKGLSRTQKEILSGVMAVEHSPLRAYVPSLLEKLSNDRAPFEKALTQGMKNLALDNFSFVNKAIQNAAVATGFTSNTKILRKKSSVLDIVFTDKMGRKLAAYCKIDKQMNPSLALDLEGFECNNDECTLKMNEIVNYLQKNGIPFNYKRLKHSQPAGVLRNLLEKKAAIKRHKELINYLYGGNDNKKNNIKQKQSIQKQ